MGHYSHFHHRIGLRCDSATINLEGKSSSWLAIDLLKRRYSSNTIRYFNIKVDYQPLPQEMAVDYAQMARAFLQYILGAYLFLPSSLALDGICLWP